MTRVKHPKDKYQRRLIDEKKKFKLKRPKKGLKEKVREDLFVDIDAIGEDAHSKSSSFPAIRMESLKE